MEGSIIRWATDIHVAACADGESVDVACPDSQKCLLFSAGEAGNKEPLNGKSTCHRQKIFAVCFFAGAHLQSQVCQGNLIALKLPEKMIQNTDSKQLITA